MMLNSFNNLLHTRYLIKYQYMWVHNIIFCWNECFFQSQNNDELETRCAKLFKDKKCAVICFYHWNIIYTTVKNYVSLVWSLIVFPAAFSGTVQWCIHWGNLKLHEFPLNTEVMQHVLWLSCTLSHHVTQITLTCPIFILRSPPGL